MKKLYSFFVLFTLLFCYTGNVWGETLTVGSDWTTHNKRSVPLNPSYHDTPGTKCQFIYTTSDLSGLEEKVLKGMRFYSDKNWTWNQSPSTVPTFSVRLKETTASTLDAFDTAGEFAAVYTGQPTSSKNTPELYFEFNGDDFTYSGTKNLLVEVSITTAGGYQTGNYYYGTVRSQAARTNKNESGSNGTVSYLPKVQITYENAAPASCPKPTITAATATSTTSGSISWTPGASETAWTLQYKANDDADWTVANLTTSNTTETDGVRSYALTGLTQSTTYQVKLKAVCGVGDESKDVSDSFETPCDDVTTYSTGFEVADGCAVEGMAPCWKKIGTPAIYSSNFNSGSQCLGFKGSTTQYAILPKFDRDVKGLLISFAYKHYYYTYYSSNLALGTMTDPTDASTFTQIKALSQTNSYVEIDEESLASAPAGDYYIAFKYTASSSSAAIYIDDVDVAIASSCVKPTGLSASAASATSINLSWTKGNDETKWNAQYRIGSGAWTAVNNISTTVEGTNCTATLTGLTAQTTYEIQVQADCSGSTSNWSISATETTNCEAKDIPWSCGFETSEGYTTGNSTSVAPECWKMIGLNNSNYPYAYVNNSSTYVKTGSQSLYIIASTYNDAYLIFPDLDAALNTLQITFQHKSENASKSAILTLGYMTDVNNASTFEDIKTFTRSTSWSAEEESLSSVPSGVASTARLAFKVGKASNDYYTGIDDITISELPSCPKPSLTATNVIYNGATITWALGSADNKWKLQYKASTDDEWSDANNGNLIAASSFNLTGLTSGTTYQVRAQAECEGAWSNAVSFQPQCVTPTGLAVNSKTSTTATIGWTVNSGEAEWNVQYKKNSDANWTTAAGVSTNPYTITGLTPGKSYQVKVAATCNGTYTSAVSFETECVEDAIAPLGYTEGFEDFATGSYASTGLLCWEELNAAHSYGAYPQMYVNTNSTYVKTGSKSLYFVSSDSKYIFAILPEFSGSFDGLQLTFSHKEEDASSSGHITLGYMTDPTDASTFEPITQSQYTRATSWNTEKENLSDVPTGARLAFRYGGASKNYYAGIDDISIIEKPACSAINASSLTASAVTANTATISWTAGDEETNWALQYKADGGSWSDPIAVATTPSHGLTGLSGNTLYYVRVKAVCGGGKESEYTDGTFNFRTECESKTLPFEETFESGEKPACWTAKVGDNDYWGSSNNNWEVKEVSGNYVMRYHSHGSVSTANMPVLTLQKIVIPSSVNATLSFKIRNISGSGYSAKTVNGKVTISAAGVDNLEKTLITNSNLTTQEVSLSDFAGKTVTIKFQATSNASSAYIDLDDIRVLENLTFADGTDNSEALSAANGKRANVTINRTIYCDGDYNTLCLPFSLATLTGTPLEDATVYAYKYAVLEPDELQVRIYETENGIQAGVPYLLKISAESNITNMTFSDVIITASEGKTIGKDEAVEFIGILKPEAFTAGDESTLFVSTGNNLAWASESANLKSFRAFFKRTASAPAPLRPGMRARIVVQEEVVTGVDGTQGNDVQCIKLIENEQLVIIRNGMKYNVQGQIIR